jgi:hypothetical protein
MFDEDATGQQKLLKCRGAPGEHGHANGQK